MGDDVQYLETCQLPILVNDMVEHLLQFKPQSKAAMIHQLVRFLKTKEATLSEHDVVGNTASNNRLCLGMGDELLQQLYAWEMNALTKHTSPAVREGIVKEMYKERQVNMARPTQHLLALSRFRKDGYISREQWGKMEPQVEVLKNQDRDKARLTIISALDADVVCGNRYDTASILRDMGIAAEWLAMDSCSTFRLATQTLLSGLQYPSTASLSMSDHETLQLVQISCLIRMQKDGHLGPGSVDVIWLDDAQLLGLIPLIRALYPTITVVWQCHAQIDPNPSIAKFVHDLLEGTLDFERDHLLCSFLAEQGVDVRLLEPAQLAAHGCVVTKKEFLQPLALKGPSARAFSLGVNPFSFKNLPLSPSFVEATINKFGIPTQDTIPPLFVQVSPLDEFSGPAEAIVTFIDTVRGLPEKDQETCHLVLGSTLPVEHESRLYKALQQFVKCIPIDSLPTTMQGDRDIRDRIHILQLATTTISETLTSCICKSADFDADRAEVVTEEVKAMHGSSADEILESLLDLGFISEDTVYHVREATEAMEGDFCKNIEFTDGQTKAVVECLMSQTATRQAVQRAKQGLLLGREMNDLEVNTLQRAARVCMDLSSSDGARLASLEALLKGPKPGFAPILVATKIEGVASDLNQDVCLAVEYAAEDVEASLQCYNAILKATTDVQWKAVFESIAARQTSKRVCKALEKAFLMPESERQAMAESARNLIIKSHTMPVSVMAMVQTMADCMPQVKDIHSPVSDLSMKGFFM